MSNWGIDTWMCEIYKPFNSCFLNTNLTMVNHVNNSKERYEIDYQFREKLSNEIRHYISIIKKHLEKYKIKYTIS